MMNRVIVEATRSEDEEFEDEGHLFPGENGKGRFTEDALTEINRIAKNRKSGVKMQEAIPQLKTAIYDYVVRGFTSSDSRRLNVLISRNNVLAYEVSSTLELGIFYFNPDWNPASSDPKFIKINTRRARGSNIRVGEDDSSLDDEDESSSEISSKEEEEINKEADEDEESDDVDEEEESKAREIGHTEEAALGQSHSALVRKTVTTSDGKSTTIPMSPLARYYQMLPPSAIAIEIKQRWEREAMPVLRHALSTGVVRSQLANMIDGKISQSADAQNLLRFFDRLRIETCLIDSEVEDILRVLLNSLENESIQESQIGLKVSQSIDAIIKKRRKNQSKLFDAVKRKDPKILTSDEYIEIDSASPSEGRLGISLSEIGKFGRTFEQMLTTRNLKLQTSDEIKQAIGKLSQSTASASLADMSSSERTAAEAEATGQSEYAPDTVRGGKAITTNEVEESMIERISQAENSNQQTVSNLLYSGEGQYVPIQVQVRSGETSHTLHNHIQDVKDFIASNSSRSSRATAKESLPSVIFAEIGKEIAKLASNISEGEFRSDPTKEKNPDLILEEARTIRDGLAFLSGLIENLAMSGSTKVTGSRLNERSKLVEAAASFHNAAMKITDSIVSTKTSIERIGWSSRIKVAIRNLQSKLAAASDEVNKKEIDSQIISLYNQLEEGKHAKVLDRIVNLVVENVKKLNINTIQTLCASYSKDVESLMTPSALKDRKGSRYAIALAETRKDRIRQSERAQIRDTTPDKKSYSSKRYESQVTSSITSIIDKNQLQIHHLQVGDTIDSLIEEYDLTKGISRSLAEGSKFRAILPKKYLDGSHAHIGRDYEVFDVKRTGKKITSYMLQYEDNGTKHSIDVPASEIARVLAAGGRSKSPVQVREEFAKNLRYCAIAALRQVSRNTTLTSATRIFSDQAIIKQLAEIIFQNDLGACNQEITNGIKSVSKSMEDAGFLDSILPDPDADNPVVNKKLEFALSVVGILSVRVGSQNTFLEEVEAGTNAKDGGLAQAQFSRIRNVVNNPDRQSDELKNAVDKFLASSNGSHEEIASLVRSVKESLSICEFGYNEMRRIEKFQAEGVYDHSLIELGIPIPASPILRPGTVLTVTPPKRTLGSVTRRTLLGAGIKINEMLSAPTKAFSSAIVNATLTVCLIPVMKDTASNLSEIVSNRIWEHYGPQVKTDSGVLRTRQRSLQEIEEMKDICKEQLLKVFIDPITAGRNDVDTAVSMLTAYKKVGALVDSTKVSTVRSVGTHESDMAESEAADAALRLKRALIDGTCDAIRSREGLNALYAIAPCTAVLLNQQAFSSPSQKRLFNILVPRAGVATKTMTTGLYSELLGAGVQKSKEGASDFSSVISRAADRMVVAVKVINDFYNDFVIEINQYGEVEAVLNRLRARVSFESNEIKEREIAKMLGIDATSPSKSEIEKAAKSAVEQISNEISVLGNAEKESELYETIVAIVRKKAGTSPATICSKMDVEKQYEEYINKTATFIKVLDVIETSDLKEMFSSNSRATVDLGSAQLVEQIAKRVYEEIRHQYAAENAEAVLPYQKRTQK